MDRKIKIGIIGAGYWGPNLVRNFFALDNCEVKYVCDLDESKLGKIKKSYPYVLLTANVEELFYDPELDAVAIATPTATHYHLAKKALEMGKHVFLEKPMTETSRQAEELINLAESKNLILQVDHPFVFYGPVIKIKELIDSGELGELYYFDSQRINLGLIQPDVNVLWDLAPHDISILNFLYGGKPKSVSAIGTKHITGNKEELAHMNIKYENGFCAHIHVSWLSPVKLRQMIIAGDKKMIYFDDIAPSEKIKVYDKSIDLSKIEQDTFNPIYRSGDVYSPVYDQTEAVLRECKEFINCVLYGKKPFSSGEFGLGVVKILEAADKSLALGGAEIIINSDDIPDDVEKSFLKGKKQVFFFIDKI
jgi:predicted dehydrogenase